MTPERFQQVGEAFAAARLLPAADRDVYLARACDGDRGLRAEVESLLAAETADAGFLATPLVPEDAGATLVLPDHIARYRVLRLLGEGGMGTVYEAEQPSPRRRVALKVVRAGLSTPSLLRRFRMEAEVLGRLDHPGIARIYEAGTADAGRGLPQPFFAMELVGGPTLVAYARDRGLSVPDRLELVALVCEAVQHAHQKGVVHRDLKPSNVLVTPDGQPKVLDFGVARVVDPGAEPAATARTDSGALVGTLQYMSPEQAGGGTGAVDTRSDVYALGVIAYELLADRLPVEVGGRPLHEAVRAIREEEPARLSGLGRHLRGDVETIVAKALAKEPGRRYGTAAEMAADIRRHLNDEPISARPPTTVYHLSRFARRNRALVGGAVAALILLVSGTVGTTVGLVRADAARRAAQDALRVASEARRDAEQRTAEAEAVADLLVQSFRRSDPAADGRELRVVDLLAGARAQLGDGFAGMPAVRARLLDALGRAYLELGLAAEAAGVLAPAADLGDRARGADHPATLASLNGLAAAYLALGRPADAARLHERVLARRERALGPDHPDALTSRNDLAVAYRALGRFADSASLHERVVARRERALGPDHPATLEGRNDLAAAYFALGRQADAARLHEQVLGRQERTLGPGHPAALRTGDALAIAERALGRLAAATQRHEWVLGQQERKLGPGHPHTLVTRNDLAIDYRALGRVSDAVRLHEQVAAARVRSLGLEHPDTLKSQNDLAVAYRLAGRPADAVPLHERVLAQYERTLGPDHPATLVTRNDLALADLALGRYADAARLHTLVLASRERTLGSDHPSALTSRHNLAAAVLALGRADEAVRLHEAVLAVRARVLSPDHPDTARSRAALAECYLAARRPTDAVRLYEQVVARRDRAAGPDDREALRGRSDLAVALRSAGRLAEAAGLHEQVLATRARVLGPAHVETLTSGYELAATLLALGRPAEAVRRHERVLVARERLLGPDHVDTLRSLTGLGDAYSAAGRPADAAHQHAAAFAQRVRRLGPDHADTLRSRNAAIAAGLEWLRAALTRPLVGPGGPAGPWAAAPPEPGTRPSHVPDPAGSE